MAKKLVVWLPEDWQRSSETDGGQPARFCWTSDAAKGVLTITLSNYVSGTIPNPTLRDLRDLAIAAGGEANAEACCLTDSGRSFLGGYGTAEFRFEDGSFLQVWVVSNKLDFVFLSLTAPTLPTDDERYSAQRIAEGVSLSD